MRPVPGSVAPGPANGQPAGDRPACDLPSRPRPGAIRRRRQPGRLRRALGARRGSVTVEFVLAAPVLLLLMGFMIDFTLLLRARIALASGLMNTVQYAMMQGPTVTAANLTSVLQNATPLNGLTASVAGPAVYCPSSYPVTLTTNVPCTTTSGTYVIVTGSYAYTPMMPGLSHLVATTVVQTATALLK